MKQRLIILLSAAFGVLVLLAIFGVWQGHLREQSLALRIADVKMLLDAYRENAQSNTVPQMRDLRSILENRNISLHNPIPKDRSLPCYRVVTNELGESAPSAVVVEETENVLDAKLRVQGYADGSIQVERR